MDPWECQWDLGWIFQSADTIERKIVRGKKGKNISPQLKTPCNVKFQRGLRQSSKTCLLDCSILNEHFPPGDHWSRTGAPRYSLLPCGSLQGAHDKEKCKMTLEGSWAVLFWKIQLQCVGFLLYTIYIYIYNTMSYIHMMCISSTKSIHQCFCSCLLSICLPPQSVSVSQGSKEVILQDRWLHDRYINMSLHMNGRRESYVVCSSNSHLLENDKSQLDLTRIILEHR